MSTRGWALPTQLPLVFRNYLIIHIYICMRTFSTSFNIFNISIKKAHSWEHSKWWTHPTMLEKLVQQHVCCNTSSMPAFCQLLTAKTSENQMQDKTVPMQHCLFHKSHGLNSTHLCVQNSKFSLWVIQKNYSTFPLIKTPFKQLSANYPNSFWADLKICRSIRSCTGRESIKMSSSVALHSSTSTGRRCTFTQRLLP